MVRIGGAMIGLAVAAHGAVVQAVPTQITVRLLARNAKLVGDPAGGASVIVRDTETGAVLASGKTVGGSGNTALLIGPKARGSVWTGPGDANFTATIDIDEPRRITVEAGAPGLGSYGGSAVSQTQWVLPGKSPQGPNGWVLELPGFMVDILKPGRHQESKTKPVQVPIEANVVLMCGCPVAAGGPWDPKGYEISYSVKLAGTAVSGGSMAYAGAPNRFTAQFAADKVGVYDIVVTAFDPESGNSGVAETTFEVDKQP